MHVKLIRSALSQNQNSGIGRKGLLDLKGPQSSCIMK